MATASRSVRSARWKKSGICWELVAGYAESEEVKSALAPVLSAVTDALVTDRKMAEQGGGSAHLGGDENNDDDGAQ
jgi:hypothetical protein